MKIRKKQKKIIEKTQNFNRKNIQNAIDTTLVAKNVLEFFPPLYLTGHHDVRPSTTTKSPILIIT